MAPSNEMRKKKKLNGITNMGAVLGSILAGYWCPYVKALMLESLNKTHIVLETTKLPLLHSSPLVSYSLQVPL